MARDTAVGGGAIQAVVLAMKTHADLPGIQEMAFKALQNLVIGQDGTSSARKDTAVEVGALEAIVAALKRHRVAGLVEEGTLTLRMITKDSKQRRAKATDVGARVEWLRSGNGLARTWTTSRSRFNVKTASLGADGTGGTACSVWPARSRWLVDSATCPGCVSGHLTGSLSGQHWLWGGAATIFVG